MGSWARNSVPRMPALNLSGCSSPIDGTKSFTAAVPLFGTLIALLHDGLPVLGCINQPILGQLLVGDNLSASLNGRPVRTRATRANRGCLFAHKRPGCDRQGECRATQSLMGRAKLARTWGDCYGYLLVATGWADVMFDPMMNLWDIAALVPVIRGAGGVIAGFQGAHTPTLPKRRSSRRPIPTCTAR